jgi:hypothetical protein
MRGLTYVNPLWHGPNHRPRRAYLRGGLRPPPFVSGTELPGVTVIELFAIVLMVLISIIVLWRKWMKARALQRLSAKRLGMLGNDRQTSGEHGAPAPQ